MTEDKRAHHEFDNLYGFPIESGPDVLPPGATIEIVAGIDDKLQEAIKHENLWKPIIAAILEARGQGKVVRRIRISYELVYDKAADAP